MSNEDINFDCPECGQNLDAPPDMVGMQIECPSCSKDIRVPGDALPEPTGDAQPCDWRTDAAARSRRALSLTRQEAAKAAEALSEWISSGRAAETARVVLPGVVILLAVLGLGSLMRGNYRLGTWMLLIPAVAGTLHLCRWSARTGAHAKSATFVAAKVKDICEDHRSKRQSLEKPMPQTTPRGWKVAVIGLWCCAVVFAAAIVCALVVPDGIVIFWLLAVPLWVAAIVFAAIGAAAKRRRRADLRAVPEPDEPSVSVSCQSCGRAMPDGAVLCVGCGWDRRTGKLVGSSEDGLKEYAYDAMDRRNNCVSGKVTARTQSEAVRVLRQSGIFPTRVSSDFDRPARKPNMRVLSVVGVMILAVGLIAVLAAVAGGDIAFAVVCTLLLGGLFIAGICLLNRLAREHPNITVLFVIGVSVFIWKVTHDTDSQSSGARDTSATQYAQAEKARASRLARQARLEKEEAEGKQKEAAVRLGERKSPPDRDAARSRREMEDEIEKKRQQEIDERRRHEQRVKSQREAKAQARRQQQQRFVARLSQLVSEEARMLLYWRDAKSRIELAKSEYDLANERWNPRGMAAATEASQRALAEMRRYSAQFDALGKRRLKYMLADIEAYKATLRSLASNPRTDRNTREYSYRLLGQLR